VPRVEEYWETVLRKLREEKEADEVNRKLRFKHADLLVISLRHLENILKAGAQSSMDTDPNALVAWAQAWETATGFIDYAKKEGLI